MTRQSCVRLLAMCALVHFPLGSCQIKQHAENLVKELFVTRQYNKQLGPVYEQTGVLEVAVKFDLMSINHLDEVSETMKTTGILVVQWPDGALSWDKTDYGGLEEILISQSDIWLPDMSLRNSNGEYKPLGVDSLKCRLHSDGTVLWTPFQVFESTCSFDIVNFPFDTQVCQLKFITWSYSTDEIHIKRNGNSLDLDEYEENSSWKILETTSTTNNDANDQASIVYTLKLQRKPTHALMSLVLPVFVLALLNLTVFILPSNSGEKSGYAMTLFLAMIVFLTIFSTYLPENSDKISILSVYVTIQTLQSMLITVVTVISIRLSAFDDSTSVPRALVLLGELVRCKVCQTKCRPRRKQSNKVEVSCDDVRNYEKNEDNEEEYNGTYSWIHVTNHLDIICIVLFSTCLFISTCVCYFEVRK